MRLKAVASTLALLASTSIVLAPAAAACGGQATVHAATASPHGTRVSVLVTFANVGAGCGTPTWVSHQATCTAPTGWVVLACLPLRPVPYVADDAPALTSNHATGVQGIFQCIVGSALNCPLPPFGSATTDNLKAQAYHFGSGWACTHSSFWAGSTTHCELH